MNTLLTHTAGQRYGLLMLTGKSYLKNVSGKNRKHVEAICECGEIYYTLLQSLKSGRTVSCGCNKIKKQKDRLTKHGLASNSGKHPIYKAYGNMISRCYNEKIKEYKNYGGRGVIVCEEWRNSFDSFYQWAINNGWENGLSLDRYPNNETGIYEPSNCRWANDDQQQNNKRDNVLISAFGETKTRMQWVNDSRCSVSYMTLKQRIKHNWPIEEAITKKAQKTWQVRRSPIAQT